MKNPELQRLSPKIFARRLPAFVWFAVACVACGIDTSKIPEDASPDGSDVPSLDPNDPAYGVEVSGSVFDFRTGAALEASATVGVSGIQPLPTVSVTGADFTIHHVPLASTFFIAAGVPPTHRLTYNLPTTVETTALTGIRLEAVAEADLAEMTQELERAPTAGTGIVIARVVDEAGQPKAGLTREMFALAGALPTAGPHFLDEAKRVESDLESTSRSGYVLFLDVPEGLVAVGGSGRGSVTLSSTRVPVVANGVTLVELVATQMPLPPLMNVSFTRDVVPALERRNCAQCHSGNGVGRDLGALTLNGASNLMYREIVEEPSPFDRKPRIDRMNPEQSALLTLPLLEEPADRHPNITFRDTTDRDYQLILEWIRAGALHN